jgi:hypothetical protein
MSDHPAFDAVADMENELSRVDGLLRASHQLIGDEKDDRLDPDKHEAMLIVLRRAFCFACF